MYGGKNWVLFGFLLLVSSVLQVRTIEHSSLDATPHEYSGAATPGDYSISSCKSEFPIDPAVTWMANRNTPLSSTTVLPFHPIGTLELSDQNQNNIWCSFTDNMDVVSASAKLQNSGKLVLKNILNGTEVCPISRFDDSPPTDTLRPGQRSQGHSLVSWQRNGNPEIVNDIYSFGWDAERVSTLLWTCSNCKAFINWKGRSSMSLDGGLRSLQYYKINQTVISNQTSNQHGKAVANRLVSDRPDLPTTALRGTNRTSHMRKQAVKDFQKPPPAKDNRWVKILALAVGILGVLLIIAVAIFCLRHYEKVWQWLRACSRCGPCCWRPMSRYQIEFPGDMPVRTESGDDGVELQVVERGSRCHCAVSCVMSCSPRI